ncbi:hypothetical protein ACHAPC_007475 [Botrytis cinerea]
MDGMKSAELVAHVRKFDLTKTRQAMSTFQAQSDIIASDLTKARKLIYDIEEQLRLWVDGYERSSHRSRQKMEPEIRRLLKNGENALLELKKRQEVLEKAEKRGIAIDELLRKHLKSLLEREMGQNA